MPSPDLKGDRMKNPDKNKKNAMRGEPKVDVYVPRAASPNEEQTLFISVNGVNYLLPKGKTSRVPKPVADEYYRSLAAQETVDRRREALIEKAKTTNF